VGEGDFVLEEAFKRGILYGGGISALTRRR